MLQTSPSKDIKGTFELAGVDGSALTDADKTIIKDAIATGPTSPSDCTPLLPLPRVEQVLSTGQGRSREWCAGVSQGVYQAALLGSSVQPPI